LTLIMLLGNHDNSDPYCDLNFILNGLLSILHTFSHLSHITNHILVLIYLYLMDLNRSL
jgi:hypothetical protein